MYKRLCFYPLALGESLYWLWVNSNPFLKSDTLLAGYLPTLHTGAPIACADNTLGVGDALYQQSMPEPPVM